MTTLLIALGKLQLSLTLVAGFLFGFKAQKAELQIEELQQLQLQVEEDLKPNPQLIRPRAR